MSDWVGVWRIARTPTAIATIRAAGVCSATPPHRTSTSFRTTQITNGLSTLGTFTTHIKIKWQQSYFCVISYRDNHHTSILSLPESYDAGDIANYEALAKNMDANLAEADIESFRTEDIHALLTNLPPMCSEQLSQEVLLPFYYKTEIIILLFSYLEP